MTAPHSASRPAADWHRHPVTTCLVSVPTTVNLTRSRFTAPERSRPGHNGRAIVARLNQLINLQPGWDGACAEPVSEPAVKAVVDVLSAIYIEALPVPDISPGIDGGLLLEWRRGGFELEVWIGAAGDVSVTYEHGESSWDGPWDQCGEGAVLVLQHLAEASPVE